MRLKSVALPKTRRFCISKAALKRTFADIESLSVHMGDLGQTFKFDERCYQRPRLSGSVVASLHAHVTPRYASETEELRKRPAWLYDLSAAPHFDPGKHGALQERIARSLAELGLLADDV